MKKINFQKIIVPVVILALSFLYITGLFSESEHPAVLAAETDTEVTGTSVPTPSTVPGPSSSGTPTPKVSPTPTVTPTPTSTPTPTPTPSGPSKNAKMSSISAYYLGESVLVGEKLDTKKINVFVFYDDGYSEQTTDFSVTENVVEEQGENKFTVMAYGFTATIYVTGKTLTRITAQCSRYVYTVGNAPDSQDLTVSAYYSDESYENITSGYTVSPSAFTEPGLQNVTITFLDQSAEAAVLVNEAPELKEISIFNKGEDIYTNSDINRNNLTVNAVYTDGSTERITTYEISPAQFLHSGDQKLTVSYRGKTASLAVKVKDLEIVSIRGEYVGEDVYVTTEYDPRYLYVYATYNNNTEQRIDDYSAYNRIIRYVGENSVKIYVGKLSTSVTIIGREMGEPDFSYVSTAEVSSNGFDITIDTAIPKILETDVTEAKKISKAKLKHLYRILGTKTENYLGFTYGFVDNSNEKYLPMTIRLTLPSEFEPEYTELYYSPNNRTILGCMNKMGIDEETLQITIYRAGTYMLVYDPEKYETEEEEEETGEDEEEED